MAFIFTSFFSRGGGAAFSFCSQIPVPVSVSFPALRLNFSFHCSPHTFYSSPSLCFSSTFSSVCHKTNKLPNLPSSHYWAFQSTPTAVVSEHLIHSKIGISLVLSPPLFKLCWKDWYVFSSSSASAFHAPRCLGETECQGRGLQKTVVSTHSFKHMRVLLSLSPRRGDEAWCNDFYANGKTDSKLSRSRTWDKRGCKMKCGKRNGCGRDV